MPLAKIPLRHIDFDDESYDLLPSCCRSGADKELIASIERFGILHPPIVKERAEASYIIVAGRKRLRIALERLQANSCDCLMLPASASAQHTLDLCLEEVLLCGTPSPIQRAVFFRTSLATFGAEQIAARYLPRMAMSPTAFLVQRDLKLLELEEPIIAAVHRGDIDEKVAYELGKLAFIDRLALFELIDALRLSVGNQKKLLIACRELAARHQQSIAALLGCPEVDAIVNHADANIPQKSGHLMKWLADERFPRLEAAKREFQRFVGSLALPESVRLEHSPSFEKDEIELRLNCRDRRQCREACERLRDLLTSPPD